MNLIACVDSNWGIGKEGKLLYSVLGDMDFFKKKTMGHPVIMGRVTFESLPKPLIRRTNLVLSRNTDYTPEGALVVNTVHDLFELLWRFDPTPGFPNTFVIGGSKIYQELLPWCDTAYITYVERRPKEADAFFPLELSTAPGWRCTEAERNAREENTWFMTYKRV